jgi:hypothetical protein
MMIELIDKMACTGLGKFSWRLKSSAAFLGENVVICDLKIYEKLVGCRISEHVAIMGFCHDAKINSVYFDMAGMQCLYDEPFADVVYSNQYPSGLKVRQVMWGQVVPIWLEKVSEQCFEYVALKMANEQIKHISVPRPNHG